VDSPGWPRSDSLNSSRFSSSKLARQLFAWDLFERIGVTVRPRRILVWPGRDFSVAPLKIEVVQENPEATAVEDAEVGHVE
jgi:hypothetical protein